MQWAVTDILSALGLDDRNEHRDLIVELHAVYWKARERSPEFPWDEWADPQDPCWWIDALHEWAVVHDEAEIEAVTASLGG